MTHEQDPITTKAPANRASFTNGADNSLNSLNSRGIKSDRIKPRLQPVALHGPAGEAVEIILPHTEASGVAILVQLLAGFGIFLGPGPYFRFGRSIHRTKINVVLVGPSGLGRKGTSWEEAEAFLSSVNPGFRNIVVSGLSSGEGLIHHVRDPLYKKTPIKEGKRIIDYQDEMIDGGADEKRAFVQEPEFSRVLKSAGREGSILSEVMRLAYDKDEFSILTKTGVKATGAHVGICAHITEFELLREMDDTAKANGFGNRFLWMYTERSKCLPLGGYLHEAELHGVIADFRAALDFSTGVHELIRTTQADDLWKEIYESLSTGYEGLLEALIARAPSHVMRLASIYAILERSSVIDVQHLQSALALWQYAEDSATYIFGRSLGDRVAETILAAIEESPNGITRTGLSDLLRRHCKAETITSALQRLERLGRVHCERENTGGAPRTLYFPSCAKKAN